MHDQTGELFLVREIDLESLSSSMLTLQIQVSRNNLLYKHSIFCVWKNEYPVVVVMGLMITSLLTIGNNHHRCFFYIFGLGQ